MTKQKADRKSLLIFVVELLGGTAVGIGLGGAGGWIGYMVADSNHLGYSGIMLMAGMGAIAYFIGSFFGVILVGKAFWVEGNRTFAAIGALLGALLFTAAFFAPLPPLFAQGLPFAWILPPLCTTIGFNIGAR